MLITRISNIKGSALISMIIYSTISVMLLGAALHGLYTFVHSNKKIMRKFTQQQAELLLQYYFKHDIYNAGFQGCWLQRPEDFKRVSICNPGRNNCDRLVDLTILNLINNNELYKNSDILILHNVAARQLPNCDYMQSDATPTPNNTTIFYYLKQSVTKNNSYALYRSDIQHQAVALIEDLNDMQILITKHGNLQLININILFSNGENIKFIFSTRNGT